MLEFTEISPNPARRISREVMILEWDEQRGGGRSDRPPMQYPMESMFTMGMSHSRMRLTGAGEGEAAWWRGEGEREPGVEQRDVVKHHEDLALRGVFSLRADEVPQVDLRRRQEISAGGEEE
jgi:hypothetical protein